MEQYHWGMELMTRAHNANRLGEFLEKGVDFDWSKVENQ
ncbi:unnamed protein product [Paramecium octaurelia]|uniref:Uncharacterized protein n=1 Tax=Paramecium octaurelia TaxID=43137 RepID=A0A8S1UKH5_PAROT|nr:unnamed protein product [Paramecium octaurelia]